MRHAAERGLFTPALAPASLTRGVLVTAIDAALIAPAGVALVGAARCTRACPAAIALAAIAVAAQQHLLATASAQEQAGWKVGQARSSGTRPEGTRAAHGSTTLDATVQRCNTGAAPATARCRARRGSRSHAMRPPPCPPLEALRAVLPPLRAPCHPPMKAPQGSDHGSRARRACMAALQGGHAGELNAAPSTTPALQTPSRAKPRPHRRIRAVPDRHSHVFGCVCIAVFPRCSRERRA